MSNYSRPRLIDESDRYYQEHVRQFILQRDNQRAIRPPRQRDLFGGEAEAALRRWLGERLTLSDRRILEYAQRRGNSQIKKYREMDAVVLTPPKAIRIFEIKATLRASSLRRAMRQLRETQAILKTLFAPVVLTVLLVDTGIPTDEDIAALLADPETAPAIREGLQPPPETLDQVLATLPDLKLVDSLDAAGDSPQAATLLRFSVDDIIAIAGAENLHLDWAEDEVEEEEEPAAPVAPPAPLYSTQSEQEDDDDNPLAAALRKAMQQRPGEE
jgi:hypothetical protein